jgi:tetratricopeptide (TPR) repeat protein
MSNANQISGCPSFEEILKAAKPGASLTERNLIRSRLQECKSYDDVALLGIIKFLKEHEYDFDALYQFLDTPLKRAKKNKLVAINMKWLSVAAALVLLIGSIGYYTFQVSPINTVRKSIFYEPGLPVFASLEGDKSFHELMSSFRTADAKTGLSFYHELISKNLQSDTLKYFGGWLYFQNQQFDSAVIAFDQVVQSNSAQYMSKAAYMQAVSVYISGDKENAQKLFGQILKDTLNPFSNKALGLLSNKSLW